MTYHALCRLTWRLQSYAGAAQHKQAAAGYALPHAAGDRGKGSSCADRGTTGRGDPAQSAGLATQGATTLAAQDLQCLPGC